MRYDVSSAEALAPVAGVLRTIDRVAVDLGATFLLVGAVARDLHLHFVADLPIQRATRDLDLAIRVESWHMYDDLLNRFGRPRLRHRVVMRAATSTSCRSVLWRRRRARSPSRRAPT